MREFLSAYWWVILVAVVALVVIVARNPRRGSRPWRELRTLGPRSA